MKRTFTLLLLAAAAQAQTTVYVRSSGPAGVKMSSIVSGAPSILASAAAHNFAAGDIIVVAGMCGSDGAQGQSLANGIHKVGTVVDSTHFTITDLNGNPVNPTSSVSCAPGATEGNKWAGKLTAYTLGPQPLGFLDGLNGSFYRKLALSIYNGLSSLTVDSSHIGHITTSYPHGINNGDHFAIWNSTNSTLNNGNSGAASRNSSGCGQYQTVNPCSAVAYAAQNTTTYTVDFPVDSSIPAGTYSGTNLQCGPASTPNGTIMAGTLDCLRVSQVAWTGNPLWDGLLVESYGWVSDGVGYKFLMDGGRVYPGSNDSELFASFAAYFLVDQTSALYANALAYVYNNVEKASGVNFSNVSGNIDLIQWGYFCRWGLGWLYLAWSPYESAAKNQTFLDKYYNDLDDPTVTPCSTADLDYTNDARNEILTSGTAQAGDGTHITLAASDSHADGYYVNNVVRVPVSGSMSYGLVTGYVSSTKVATVSSWSNGNPGAGSAYTIFGTMAISSTASGATATVTGYNTTFTSHLTVGDAIIGSTGTSGVSGNSTGSYMSKVTAVTDDTHATVINSGSILATSAPSIVWYVPKWKSGDCGLSYETRLWVGEPGAQPLTYPPQGGYLAGESGNQEGIVAEGHMGLDFAAAPNEPRAIRDLAISQSYFFDYDLRHYLNYLTGFAHSGVGYSFFVHSHLDGAATILAMSLPAFPSMDLTGPWITQFPLWVMYSAFPDYRNDGSQNHAWPIWWGAETVSTLTDNNSELMFSGIFTWNPTSNIAKYFRNWLSQPKLYNLWGWAGMHSNYYEAWTATQNDPNKIGNSDYTVLPNQYLFQNSSYRTCATLTGWPCPATMRGDAVISRTGWTDPYGSVVYFGARTYFADHDDAQNGTLKIYATGNLLDVDSNPTGAMSSGESSVTLGDMLQVGADNSTVKMGAAYGQIGTSPIVQWASAGNGYYGSNNYVFACADLSGAYTVSFTYAYRCFAHLKDKTTNSNTGQELVVEWDSIKLSSAISGGITEHIHYPQTGETGVSAYPEGTTTYSGGQVTEAEDGGTDSYGNPTRNHALVTHFLAPGTTTIRDDGVNYTGGAGHSHRVSVCAGSSCGSTAQALESLIVHRVTTLSDETLSTTALNPDANWTGFQSTDKVFLVNRGGTTHSTMTGFTTTHNGTAQYLLAGLTPGTYAVTVNGSAVKGSPFAVAWGDNTIEFESIAGLVALHANAPTNVRGSVISGTVETGGAVIVQ